MKDYIVYMMPAAAGPIALKRDIAVMAIPLAAPLWSCLCGCQYINMLVLLSILPSLRKWNLKILTTALF